MRATRSSRSSRPRWSTPSSPGCESSLDRKETSTMFVGHYGPSFAAKALKQSIPLWILFIAVQWVDVMWSVLVLLGIEKVRIVPGITATNPLVLYYMPYTHSLLATILWSLGAVLAYRAIPKLGSWVTAGIVGAAVFSHWVLDLLVHPPGLPLYAATLAARPCVCDHPVLSFPVPA